MPIITIMIELFSLFLGLDTPTANQIAIVSVMVSTIAKS